MQQINNFKKQMDIESSWEEGYNRSHKLRNEGIRRTLWQLFFMNIQKNFTFITRK